MKDKATFVADWVETIIRNNRNFTYRFNQKDRIIIEEMVRALDGYDKMITNDGYQE